MIQGLLIMFGIMAIISVLMCNRKSLDNCKVEDIQGDSLNMLQSNLNVKIQNSNDQLINALSSREFI